MPGIQCKITDSKLFSGSADLFRSINGGYWHEVDSDDGTEVAFKITKETAPDGPNFDRIFMSDNQYVIDKNAIMPNHKVPIRVVGTGLSVETDDEWRTVWYGGTYGPKEYGPAYTEEQFEFINFNYEKPYAQLPATLLTTAYDPTAIQISYDYRNYLEEYESYQIGQMDMSELLLPNYYLMADLKRWTSGMMPTAAALYPIEMRDYLSRYDNISFNLNQFFDNNPDRLPSVPDWLAQPDKAIFNNNLNIKYLSSSYVTHPLSASSENWATTKMKNMLFDSSAVKRISISEGYTPPLEEKLPYNMKINFITNLSDTFTKTIVENGYDSEFIKSLYQIFSGKSDNLQPVAKSYNKSSNYYSASIDSDNITGVAKTEPVSYREIDYLQMVLNSHNTYTDADDEYMFVGPATIQREAAQTDSKAYRYANTQPAIATLRTLMEYISVNPNETKVLQWSELYSDITRHTETVAYRIEKIGGPASGDSNTQSALQNYWFINSRPTADPEPHDPLPFNFIDSQVKYGQEYTYNVYAYVLTAGIRYNFSDLTLSRQIGCENATGDKIGLEFYNPSTGDRSNRLLLDDTATYSSKFSQLSGTFLTEASVFSQYPYAADFYLNYEPQIKIIEIPLYSKSLKILDNPVNEVSVAPFGTEGTDNKLGFNIKAGTYTTRTYPTPVTDVDTVYKQQYLHANDLTDSMTISNPSVTNPVQVLVYRSTTKPKSITEMQYNLYDTIDMRIPQQKYATFGATTYYDKIAPNKKYYYLFKSLNEHDIQSHLTPVYEAQIINDGGYSYAIFNTIMESELEEKVYTNPTKQLKNLIQLQPNLSQLQINTQEADFSNSAASELANVSIGTADDLIWDKTFKVRLTSKKTGKKIDFNITYNLRSE